MGGMCNVYVHEWIIGVHKCQKKQENNKPKNTKYMFKNQFWYLKLK